jgi:hypothetical protein
VFELGGSLANDGALVIEVDVSKWTSFTAEDLIG